MPAHWRGSLHEPSQHGPTQREQPINERDTPITMRTATESARRIQRTLPLKGRLTRGGGRPAPGQVGSAGRAAAERGGGSRFGHTPHQKCVLPNTFLYQQKQNTMSSASRKHADIVRARMGYITVGPTVR